MKHIRLLWQPDNTSADVIYKSYVFVCVHTHTWDSNVWLWVLRDSDHWQIALQITDPSSHQRERPKTKSTAIFQQKKGKSKIWSWAPKGCPTPRYADWLTVSRKVTSTSHTCWPPLRSSGQSSWLHIQRSGLNSRRFQIFWEVVGLERGPLSLVSTNDKLTKWCEQQRNSVFPVAYQLNL
jgi:hypothetical protein